MFDSKVWLRNICCGGRLPVNIPLDKMECSGAGKVKAIISSYMSTCGLTEVPARKVVLEYCDYDATLEERQAIEQLCIDAYVLFAQWGQNLLFNGKDDEALKKQISENAVKLLKMPHSQMVLEDMCYTALINGANKLLDITEALLIAMIKAEVKLGSGKDLEGRLKSLKELFKIAKKNLKKEIVDAALDAGRDFSAANPESFQKGLGVKQELPKEVAFSEIDFSFFFAFVNNFAPKAVKEFWANLPKSVVNNGKGINDLVDALEKAYGCPTQEAVSLLCKQLYDLLFLINRPEELLQKLTPAVLKFCLLLVGGKEKANKFQDGKDFALFKQLAKLEEEQRHLQRKPLEELDARFEGMQEQANKLRAESRALVPVIMQAEKAVQKAIDESVRIWFDNLPIETRQKLQNIENAKAAQKETIQAQVLAGKAHNELQTRYVKALEAFETIGQKLAKLDDEIETLRHRLDSLRSECDRPWSYCLLPESVKEPLSAPKVDDVVAKDPILSRLRAQFIEDKTNLLRVRILDKLDEGEGQKEMLQKLDFDGLLKFISDNDTLKIAFKNERLEHPVQTLQSQFFTSVRKLGERWVVKMPTDVQMPTPKVQVNKEDFSVLTSAFEIDLLDINTNQAGIKLLVSAANEFILAENQKVHNVIETQVNKLMTEAVGQKDQRVESLTEKMAWEEFESEFNNRCRQTNEKDAREEYYPNGRRNEKIVNRIVEQVKPKAEKQVHEEISLDYRLWENFKKSLLFTLVAGLKEFVPSRIPGFKSESHFHRPFKEIFLRGCIQTAGQLVNNILDQRRNPDLLKLVHVLSCTVVQSSEMMAKQFSGL